MEENLNYKTGNSWCYNNKDSNCSKYGRLYDWGTATKACPAGWHLPTEEDWWTRLERAVGESAGIKLRASTPDWDGTNEFGFSALPGGDRDADGNFKNLGSVGNWWTATGSGTSAAFYEMAAGGYAGVAEYHNDKGFGFSVRCVQD
jgi:uncharacterized protein (TIGR02145 family)